MPVPGRRDGIADYPSELKDSLSILPYKAGGTTTLGAAGVAEDLVLVDDLRRFENDIIGRGTHTGGCASTSLVDATQAWSVWGIVPGDRVTNECDGCSFGVIAAIDDCTDTITVTLTGGCCQNFDCGDVYNILSLGGCYRANSIRDINVASSLELYGKFDGEATVCDHDFHILAGGAYNVERKRIISRISILNVVCGETPVVRFTVFGI